MQKLKEYKYIILIVLLVLGFAFYWYQVRPMQIVKSCAKKAKDLVKDQGYDDATHAKNYEFFYKVCLRSKGLK